MKQSTRYKQFSLFSQITIPAITQYRAIDLFAGIGGIRLGFQQVFRNQIEFVFASEIDKYARITYESNFGDIPHGDITKIEPQDIPAFDILLAGFPCQPFSHAGLKKGFDDTRGTLFFNIAKIVEFHLPKIIFLENVKGFKNHDNGNTFSVVKRSLNNLGYKVFAEVLNAKDFGIPQNRERIYIVAFLDTNYLDNNYLENDYFDFPVPPKYNTKLANILEKEVDPKYTISDKLWSGHQRRKLEHIEKGNGFGYSLFDQNSQYTSTISARYYKDGSEILIAQENNNPRKITPREAARLQGFPEEFSIVVSDTQAYRQFGNSVAVPVVKSIAECIYNSLLKVKINDN